MKLRKLVLYKKVISAVLFAAAFSFISFSFQNCSKFEVSSGFINSSSTLNVVDYASINSKIIVPKCLSCHNTANPRGGIDFSSYTKMLTSNVIIPFDHARSLIYIAAANGSMPVGGPQISAELLEDLKTWINAGALEHNLAPQECVPNKKVLPRLSHYEYENILNDILVGRLNNTTLKNLPELPPLFGFDNISDSKIDKVTAEAYLNVSEDMAGQLLASPDVMSRCPVRPFYLQTWDNCAKEIISYVGERLFRRPLRVNEMQRLQSLFLSHQSIGMDRIRTSTEVPIGNLEGFNSATGQIAGWVYDPDWPERSVEVLFFAKPSGSAAAPIYIGSALANLPRPDVNSVMGFPGDRGYVFSLPAAYLTGQTFTISAKILANAQDRDAGSPIDIQGTQVTPPSGRSEFSFIFTDSLRSTLIAALLSPNFLYKMEYFPGGFLSDETSYKNAAKLSLAIGSTYPDAEAMILARNLQYTNPNTLADEAERLIIKYKSRFTTSFGGQWLGFKKALKKSNTSLEYSMAMESKLVLEKVIADNLFPAKLLEPGFSFLNSIVATQYQVPGNFTAENYSLVPTSQRGGLLSQGQFLTRTATSVESHPIKRGIWVLDTLLCSALPVLSAATFEEIANAQSTINPAAPLSERMRLHRSSGARCSTCHNQIDPIGLALDNWDRNGLYRTAYANGQTVESGLLFNGTRVSNPYELAHAVAGSSQFRNCVKRKVNAYLSGVNPTQPESCSNSRATTNDESVKKLTTSTVVEAILRDQ